MTTTFATYGPGAGTALEEAPETTAQDIETAARAADNAYWDYVAETF